MDPLLIILSAVSKHTGIAMADIVDSNTHPASVARGIASVIIRDDFPHLRKEFVYSTGKTDDAFRKSVLRMEEKMATNPAMLLTMNRVRKSLNLMPWSRIVKKARPEHISDTMRLFGFDYTEQDRLHMREAMVSAAEYMADLCAEGKHPSDFGVVYSVRRKSNPRAWYKG